MSFKKVKGFLLAELCIVLFILAYLMRMFLPMFFTKTNSSSATSGKMSYMISYCLLQRGSILQSNYAGKIIQFPDNYKIEITKGPKTQGLPKKFIVTIYHHEKQIETFIMEEKETLIPTLKQ